MERKRVNMPTKITSNENGNCNEEKEKNIRKLYAQSQEWEFEYDENVTPEQVKDKIYSLPDLDGHYRYKVIFNQHSYTGVTIDNGMIWAIATACIYMSDKELNKFLSYVTEL